MEACATAHYWARELSKLGHAVRLIPPAYAKAYVRRNKNDPADAAAICEAVGRPAMRFVTIKTAEQQAAAGVHKVRELLMKQRTMLMNSLRGLMAEFGIVVAEGPRHIGELVAILVDPGDRRIPAPLHGGLVRIAEALRHLERQIEFVDKQILDWGRGNKTCRHLITIPGFGPILSTAMAAIVVNPAAFRSGRDFLRLARPGAATGWHGWQGQARPDQQAWQRLSAPAAGERRDDGIVRQTSQAGLVAGQIAGHQRAQGRGRCARQQNGAHRLGDDDAPRGLPGRGGGGLNGRRWRAWRACEGEHA
jgi:transposase